MKVTIKNQRTEEVSKLWIKLKGSIFWRNISAFNISLVGLMKVSKWRLY